MPNGCVPRKKKTSLLTTKLKKSKSGAAENTREEEEVSPEDMEAETKKRKKMEGQEMDKMATYEHLRGRAFIQVL